MKSTELTELLEGIFEEQLI